MTTRVKICGITRAEDAMLAVAMGASAIGFVFWPDSPRLIAPAAARVIADALPPFVTRVGVFVNAPAAEVVHRGAGGPTSRSYTAMRWWPTAPASAPDW
jgi:phosphoribosylanthranilate isomerase